MYHSLQAGRAIAATLVVLFHLGGTIAAEKYFGMSGFSLPFSFGDSGVEFFFVLSGFIIFHAHKSDLGKPNSIKHYLYKRVTRIYPVYIIVFLGVYGLAISIPQLRNTVPHDISLILQSLLLIPLDKELVGGTGAPVLVVAWTLQFEMMFYLAFALGILNRLAGAILIATYLIGLGFGLSSFGFPFSFLFSDYILLFIMGMLVSHLTSYSSSLKSYAKNFALIGLFVYSLTAVADITKPEVIESYEAVLYGFGCSLVVLALVLFEKQGIIVLKHKFFQLLGNASYALYLIHYPLISILCKFSLLIGLKDLGMLGALFAYLVTFIICILVSVAFHLVIEKPLAKWLRQIIEKPNKSMQRTAEAAAD